MRADAAHLPGAACVLQTVVRSDRAPQCAVHLVDSRPRGARPVLRDADPHGCVAGAAAEDDADDRCGSGSAEDDAVHADPVHLPVSYVTSGLGVVLVCEQRTRDWPAGTDQQDDRRAAGGWEDEETRI